MAAETQAQLDGGRHQVGRQLGERMPRGSECFEVVPRDPTLPRRDRDSARLIGFSRLLAAPNCFSLRAHIGQLLWMSLQSTRRSIL